MKNYDKLKKKDKPWTNPEYLWYQLEHLGKSQQQLANELGINRQTIIRWVNKFKGKTSKNLPKHNKNLKDREREVAYLIISCKRCRKQHKVNKAYDNYSCTCKANLMYCCSVNYLNSKVIYMNKNFIKNMLAGVYK